MVHGGRTWRAFRSDVERLSRKGAAQKSISSEAISALQDYDWTGNIREFRNVMERLHILGSTEISREDVLKFAHK